VSDEPLDLAPPPDDLYALYTGGTTGMPKAVLWRQHDIYLNTMGGRNFGTGEMMSSLEEIIERSRPDGPGSMTCAPLMHGAAQWAELAVRQGRLPVGESASGARRLNGHLAHPSHVSVGSGVRCARLTATNADSTHALVDCRCDAGRKCAPSRAATDVAIEAIATRRAS
jgi:hypothetical protein